MVRNYSVVKLEEKYDTKLHMVFSGILLSGICVIFSVPHCNLSRGLI